MERTRGAPQGTEPLEPHSLAHSPPEPPGPPARAAAGGTGEEPPAPAALGHPWKLRSARAQPGTAPPGTMVWQALVALCILTAGLKVESVPTSPPLPVSVAAKITPPPVTGTGSAHSTAAAATTTSPTSGPRNASVAPTVAAAPTHVHPKNISTEPGEEAVPSTASKWEGTNPEPSPPGLTSTSGGAHLAPMTEAHSSGSPEASLPVTGTLPPVLSSSPAPSSLTSSLPTSLPDLPSPSVTSEGGSGVTSILASGAPTTPESPAEGHSSGPTPTSHATAEPVPKEKTTQYVEPDIMICDPETTTTFLIMQEVEHALSSGSIAAITVTVIAVVLLVFGMAAYLKIRHSSYGRLLDDHDYGSWGNYNNPLYDDS